MDFQLLQYIRIQGESLSHDFLLHHQLSSTLKINKKKKAVPLTQSVYHNEHWVTHLQSWFLGLSTHAYLTAQFNLNFHSENSVPIYQTSSETVRSDQVACLFTFPTWATAYRKLYSFLSNSSLHSWGWIYDEYTACLVRVSPLEFVPTVIQINVERLFQTQNQDAFSIWWNLLYGSHEESILNRGVECNQEWLLFRFKELNKTLQSQKITLVNHILSSSHNSIFLSKLKQSSHLFSDLIHELDSLFYRLFLTLILHRPLYQHDQTLDLVRSFFKPVYSSLLDQSDVDFNIWHQCQEYLIKFANALNPISPPSKENDSFYLHPSDLNRSDTLWSHLPLLQETTCENSILKSLFLSWLNHPFILYTLRSEYFGYLYEHSLHGVPTLDHISNLLSFDFHTQSQRKRSGAFFTKNT